MGSHFKLSRHAALRLLSPVTVLAATGIYQVVSDARERGRFGAPGRLADIGGRRIHLMEAGQGSPTVVIVPALGEAVLGYLALSRGVAGYTRACVYDRAGIGWSDRPPRGRGTFADMADDLHDALAAAGIAPPYVLVGHSMGGIIARDFAVRYRSDVAGMMLLDSSHEAQAGRLPGSARRALRSALRWCLQPMGLRRLAARAGRMRGLAAEIDQSVPPEYHPAAWALTLSSRFRRMAARELAMMTRPHGNPPDLGSLPLTVITAGKNNKPIWVQLQGELAALSTDAEHIIAHGAGHFVHWHDPDLVVKAIQDLLHRATATGQTQLPARGAQAL
jgi:pimeloyl-ACP methyl ester carboxylesterase